MERSSERLYLSVITVAEVEQGIAKARRLGASVKAERLSAWLEAVLHLYSARILTVDVAVARLLGRMSDHVRHSGQALGLADLAIAATAASHSLVILTRNMRHFKDLGVRALDPFEALPDSGG